MGGGELRNGDTAQKNPAEAGRRLRTLQCDRKKKVVTCYIKKMPMVPEEGSDGQENVEILGGKVVMGKPCVS